MNARIVEVLIDKFGVDVYRFSLKLCGNKYDAEDLYQRTFLKLLETDLEIDWDHNPRSLLFSIVYRIWNDRLRKLARRHRIAPCYAIDEHNHHLIADSLDVEREVISNWVNEKLHTIIQELSDKYRIPIILYYLFDESIQEIANVMEKPQGTVKSRLAKGRKLIKKRLEEEGYEYS